MKSLVLLIFGLVFFMVSIGSASASCFAAPPPGKFCPWIDRDKPKFPRPEYPEKFGIEKIVLPYPYLDIEEIRFRPTDGPIWERECTKKIIPSPYQGRVIRRGYRY